MYLLKSKFAKTLIKIIIIDHNQSLVFVTAVLINICLETSDIYNGIHMFTSVIYCFESYFILLLFLSDKKLYKILLQIYQSLKILHIDSSSKKYLFDKILYSFSTLMKYFHKIF